LNKVRKIVLVALILLVALLTGVFAYNNPDRVALDIGFTRFENVSIVLAFAVALGIGWLFGLATASFTLIRMAGERRRLRRDLKLAEVEVSTLRSLPLHDAN
jgi:putative membrane protein